MKIQSKVVLVKHCFQNKIKKQPYKPGSVSFKRRTLVIYLDLPLPTGSSDLPAKQIRRLRASSPELSLFGLSTPEVYHHNYR